MTGICLSHSASHLRMVRLRTHNPTNLFDVFENGLLGRAYGAQSHMILVFVEAPTLEQIDRSIGLRRVNLKERSSSLTYFGSNSEGNS
jgi:hypothetical protein